MPLSHVILQYGDVFTFVLLGRKVTVALGSKGNNFVLGGKSTAFSAEDAYTVYSSFCSTIFFLKLSTASHDPRFRQRRRVRCP
jgi:hypothetical protein